MKKKISIRAIKKSDSDDVLNWRNDPLTIKNSLSQNKISKKEHNNWIYRALKENGNYYFIAELNNEKIGIISYELNRNKNFFISINLKPRHRNKGFGKQLLLLTQKTAQIKRRKNLIYARIKKNNYSSIKAFNNANFDLSRECKNYLLFCCKINYAD